MKCLIKRTSVWKINKKSDLMIPEPYNSRLKNESYDRIDIRSLSSPEEYDSKFKDKWLDKGTDHKIVDGEIQRTFKDDLNGWFLEFNNLEDFEYFIELVGKVVIDTNWSNEDIKEIEIYDFWRE